MSSVPKRPEDIFDEFKAEYTALFGDDLIAIILYGSGARGEYTPKQSDLNFLIVLSEEGMERLSDTMDLVAKWRKRSVPVPLFLTKAYIESSLDAFPLEFFNIRTAYHVIHGDDILKDLSIKREDLRLQCERELKAKHLLLRELFLQSQGDVRLLRELISQSLPAFTSIFKALLFLKQDKMPGKYEAVIQGIAEAFGVDGNLFEKLSHIKKGETKSGKDQLKEIVVTYITEIKKLSKLVDAME